ncbi:MAG: flavodoxin family protein [bacterium]
MKVLAVLASGRKQGYTATLLREAIKGVKSIEDVQVEAINLHDFSFGSCNSCFNCIRDSEHRCTLNDDFGRKGKGELFQKVQEANGLLIADPVHHWGPSAQTHLFFERCYPFLWSGELNGIPFASISCASNQGMQLLAHRNLCKWAFCYSMRYIGGLPAHTAYFRRALRDARTLGQQLGEATLKDAREGRRKLTDNERFHYYLNKPWRVLEPYFENLSNGSFCWESSLIAEAISEKSFSKSEALELLEKAGVEFQKALRYYQSQDYDKAIEYLVKASAFWTHATWKEFLEQQVIKAKIPKTYRPLKEGGN